MAEAHEALLQYLTLLNGKIAAQEVILRAFIKGMAADKPNPSGFIVERLNDLANNAALATWPEGMEGVRNVAVSELRRIGADTAKAVFEGASERLTTSPTATQPA